MYVLDDAYSLLTLPYAPLPPAIPLRRPGPLRLTFNLLHPFLPHALGTIPSPNQDQLRPPPHLARPLQAPPTSPSLPPHALKHAPRRAPPRLAARPHNPAPALHPAAAGRRCGTAPVRGLPPRRAEPLPDQRVPAGPGDQRARRRRGVRARRRDRLPWSAHRAGRVCETGAGAGDGAAAGVEGLPGTRQLAG
ncbi:MAG: hypothetical protein Q9206_006827 [Seirophora lacunosa]